MINCFRRKRPLLLIITCGLLASCSVNRQVAKQAKLLLADSAVNTGHVGISIYEPATGKYWYSHNATQYFIPASNTKLFSLYAGMKYLGDSLVGLRYQYLEDNLLLIQPTGDPTFLLPEFNYQPVYNFLKNQNGKQIILLNPKWKEISLGYGWAWDDYQSDYMAERSAMPIYGNIVRFIHTGKKFEAVPKYFRVDNELYYSDVVKLMDSIDSKYNITRDRGKNSFTLSASNQSNKKIEIPFMSDLGIITSLLKDTLNKTVFNDPDMYLDSKSANIHSQPSDSLFKPMMHRSDNFFAEQTLLMASNEYLGYMSDEKMIDTILKSSLKDVPQKPKWVDGSGLSRYNLFTPNSFVYILNKMKDEFGLERMKVILATGGEGTLSSYYKNIAGNIYAKTGTLSNNCALSGYLITAKGKLLIFSILNNNYISGATPVRRAAERFLQHIQKNF